MEITFNPPLPLPTNPLPLSIGGSCQLHVKIQPKNATDKRLAYTSNNEDVASVNDKGLITAKAAGSAKITIRAAEGITKDITVTVTPATVPVTEITFNPPLPAQPIELVIGTTYQFYAKAMPEEATNKKLHFTTSDSSIAWLQGEENSQVRADKVGEATVTITAEGNPAVSKVIHFKMKPKPSIKINAPSVSCESNEGECQHLQ